MHIPPNLGPLSVLIVSFLVFWFIFNRIFWRPFLGLFDARERKLEEMSARTERLLAEQKEIDRQWNEQLAALRRAELAHREAQRRQAEERAAVKVQDARTQARTMIEHANELAQRELKLAEQSLDELAKKLAAQLAVRVLGRSLKQASSGT
jgi:F-type H+-transporting ATPase subunit b